jgi:restriction endonuclease Mrr
MARRRTKKYTRSPQRRRRAANNGSGILYLLLIMLVIGLFFFVMQHPLILLIAFLLAAGTGALLLWMKYRRYRQLQDVQGQSVQAQYMNTTDVDYQAKQQVLRQNQQQRESTLFQHYERQQREQQEKTRLAMISQLTDLRLLTPTEFEKYTGRLLEALGYYNVQHTGQSGDLCADLIATSPHGEHTVIQCKRYGAGNTIVSKEIQTFIGMIFAHHGAQKGIYVTTSTFTTPARNLAQQHAIQLIDGPMLMRLAQQHVLQQRMH